MTKLKGLLLTEGMHGMISQVEGLAKALDLEFVHEKIELNNFWKLLPPKITPVQDFVFKNKINSNFDIIISCGRKSVIPSIYLKQKYKGKILNIHIQDPKVLLNNFDFIVAPEHDGLIGQNVLSSKGAIHYLTINELNKNENYLTPRINNQKKLVSLIIGGPNKYYDYNEQIINDIFLKIEKIFLKNSYQLILVPSMRTPLNIIEKAKKYFNKDQIIITNIDKKAYHSALKLADHIVITCDSTSMISEAAITGTPIYVAQMPAVQNDQRFKNFFSLFKSLNIIKELNNSIESWSYTELNETNRIAEQLKNRIKQNDFS